MKFDDIYKPPFHDHFGIGVSTREGVRCFDWMVKIPQESKQLIVDILNGRTDKSVKREVKYSQSGQVSIDGINVMLIRGWGHLTGEGALNLPYRYAAKIGENNLLMIATAYTTPPYRVSMSDIETPPEELLEDGVPAPTQTALSKWLREKHDMYVSVDIMMFKRGWNVCIISIPRELVCAKARGFDTYEEAMEEGLKLACKIVKKRRGNE